MFRYFSILLLFTAFLPAALQAQVATTDLLPGISRFIHPNALGFNSASFTPDNPAALAWIESSSVGGGLIQGSFTDNLNSANDFNYDGKFLGFRIMGDTFSGAGELQDTTDDQGGIFFQDETTNAQLSIKVSDVFSLGVGSDGYSDGNGNNDYDRLTFGGSFNLGEEIYFGAALMKEDLNFGGVTGTRDGTQLGVAYRSDGSVYLAYDILELEEEILAGVPQANGLKFSTISAQFQMDKLVLGAALINLSGQGVNNDLSAKIIDVAWVQDAGLSVSGRVAIFTETDAAATTDREVQTTSLGVTWMF